jgi:hypothetical protein
MITANINEVKAKLSYYLKLATENGERITICNHNTPVAEIRAIALVKKNKIKLGVCKEKIVLPKNFHSTSKEIIDSFYATEKFK